MQKSITFSQRALPYLVTNKKFEILIAGDMLQMAVRSLMAHKADMHAPINNLITDIYTLYINRSTPLPKQIFSQIPGISENKLTNLNKELKKLGVGSRQQDANNLPSQSHIKKCRALMKKFLEPIAGKQSGEFKKTVSIISLNGGKPKSKNTNQASFLDDVSVNEFMTKLFQ